MLLGLVATIVVPNLQNQVPGYKRKQFITHVTALSRLAWQQALAQQKAFRLFFDIEKHLIKVEQETDKKDKDGRPVFQEVAIPYLKSTYEWPENILIKQFFIDKQELMARVGIKTQEVWFYFAADGLAQPVIINIVDTNDLNAQGKPEQRSLVINPFTGQFKEYDEFQKP